MALITIELGVVLVSINGLAPLDPTSNCTTDGSETR